MDTSEAVELRVRERAALLDQLDDRITSIHAVVQAPHRHHHEGNLYEVRLVVHVPGAEVVVNHEGPRDHAHEDVYVAVRDAFDAAERKLKDLARRRDHRGAKH